MSYNRGWEGVQSSSTPSGSAALLARRAFVLVDLLMVCAIIGILLAALLPAIQAAREATRQSQCKNHLRKIAFGCLKHERAHKSFPYSGWSFGWMGDPDQGIGPQQPGSWIYTTGPFMELGVRFDIGAGLPWEEKKVALAEQMATVVPVFHCPSRREAKAYPAFGMGGTSCENGARPKNAYLPAAVAKSDYAINGGDGLGWDDGAGGTGGAPEESCLHQGGFGGAAGPGTYPNCAWHIGGHMSEAHQRYWQNFNGVSGWRTAARTSQISDGVSKTILVGEKFMQPFFYEHPCPGPGPQVSKGNAGDNGSMYIGWDMDIARRGALTRDEDAMYPQSAGVSPSHFGGPHPRAANFAFCDGSVRSIRYDVMNFERFVVRNDADLPAN